MSIRKLIPARSKYISGQSPYLFQILVNPLKSINFPILLYINIGGMDCLLDQNHTNTLPTLPLAGTSHSLNFSTQFFLKQSSSSVAMSPTIRNYICKKVGSHFLKVTEICFGRQTIVLEDIYEFNEVLDDFSSQQLNTEASGVIPKDDSADPKSSIISDRKNVVKNIVKTFQGWLQESAKQGKELMKALRALKQLLRRNLFNNSLVYKIIERESVGLHFYNFLVDKARALILNSKIVDKETTLKMLETYEYLCEKHLQSPLTSQNAQ